MSAQPSFGKRVADDLLRLAFHPVRPRVQTHARELGWTPDSMRAYCPSCGHDVGINQLPQFESDVVCPPRCHRCVDTKSPIDRTVRLSAFTSPMNDWVRDIKFHVIRSTARYLGKQLATQLAPTLSSTHSVIVVPVPSPRVRTIRRGIDHTYTLAHTIGRELNVPVRRALRARAHAPQRTQSLARRPRNAAGVFTIRTDSHLEGRHIVLVDDVTTTGSTLLEAAKTLRSSQPSPVRITAAVLAVTPESG